MDPFKDVHYTIVSGSEVPGAILASSLGEWVGDTRWVYTMGPQATAQENRSDVLKIM